MATFYPVHDPVCPNQGAVTVRVNCNDNCRWVDAEKEANPPVIVNEPLPGTPIEAPVPGETNRRGPTLDVDPVTSEIVSAREDELAESERPDGESNRESKKVGESENREMNGEPVTMTFGWYDWNRIAQALTDAANEVRESETMRTGMSGIFASAGKRQHYEELLSVASRVNRNLRAERLADG